MSPLERKFEQTLAWHRAPSLAGIKPADLVAWNPPPSESGNLLRHYGAMLAQRGIKLRLLGEYRGRMLLLVYRQGRLEACLRQPQVAAMLRQAGAAEVHLRIVSPEVKWPCFYGIDTDTREQLIAANMTLEEMNDWIGSDSLAFISLDGLRASLADAGHDGFCTACFTGDYPVPITDDVAKKSFLTRKDFEAVYAGEVS